MLLNCEVRSVQRSESVAPRSLFFQAEDSRSRSLFVGNKDEDAQRSCEALWHQVHLCCRLVQGFLGSFLFFYAYHSLPSWLLPGKRFRILVFFVPARMTSVTDVPLMNSSNEFDHTQGILEWVQICTTSFSSDQKADFTANIAQRIVRFAQGNGMRRMLTYLFCVWPWQHFDPVDSKL